MALFYTHYYFRVHSFWRFSDSCYILLTLMTMTGVSIICIFKNSIMTQVIFGTILANCDSFCSITDHSDIMIQNYVLKRPIWNRKSTFVFWNKLKNFLWKKYNFRSKITLIQISDGRVVAKSRSVHFKTSPGLQRRNLSARHLETRKFNHHEPQKCFVYHTLPLSVSRAFSNNCNQ